MLGIFLKDENFVAFSIQIALVKIFSQRLLGICNQCSKSVLSEDSYKQEVQL
jgi:hypothetical protein